MENKIEWVQIAAIIIGNLTVILPLWLWSRSESRSDARSMEARMESQRTQMQAQLENHRVQTEAQIENHRVQTEAQINSVKEAFVSAILAIKDEMKDFHGRLCSIEEKHRQGKN